MKTDQSHGKHRLILIATYMKRCGMCMHACKRERILVKSKNEHVGLRIIPVHPRGFGFKHHCGVHNNLCLVPAHAVTEKLLTDVN